MFNKKRGFLLKRGEQFYRFAIEDKCSIAPPGGSVKLFLMKFHKAVLHIRPHFSYIVEQHCKGWLRMSGVQLLILTGIIILSLSVLAIVSPRAFRYALRLLVNALFGVLALSIVSMLWPIIPIGINQISAAVCALLGLPGALLLILLGCCF